MLISNESFTLRTSGHARGDNDTMRCSKTHDQLSPCRFRFFTRQCLEEKLSKGSNTEIVLVDAPGCVNATSKLKQKW